MNGSIDLQENLFVKDEIQNASIDIFDQSNEVEVYNGLNVLNGSKERSKNGGRPSVECVDCKKVFPTVAALGRHQSSDYLESITQPSTISNGCVSCGKSFATKRDLIAHKKQKCMKNRKRLLKCSICDDKLPTLDDLRLHKEIHIDKGMHKCEFCKKKFIHEFILNYHIRTIHLNTDQTKSASYRLVIVRQEEKRTKNVQFECVDCKTNFATKAILKRHQQTQHSKESTEKANGPQIDPPQKEKTIKCNSCDEQFLTRRELTAHKRSHQKQKQYKCTICGLKFPQLNSLNVHKESHLNEQSLECSFCKEKFFEEYLFNDHIKSKHNNQQQQRDKSANVPVVETPQEEQTIQEEQTNGNGQHQIEHETNEICEIGNIEQETETENVPSVDVIINKKQPKSAKQKELVIAISQVEFECFDCKKRFPNKLKLKNHFHIKAEFQCKICLKYLISWNNLRDHLLTHGSNKPFQCNQCPKKFYRKPDIKLHTIVHHSDIEQQKFECYDCKKRFPRLCNLKSHQISHTKDKCFKCDYCDKRFTRHASKILHQKRYHLQTRPIPKWHNYYVERKFPCNFCEKMFKRKEHVQTHVNSVHNTDRPFKCEKCNKSFKLECSLKIHSVIHSEETPYKCSFCEKSFRLAASMKLHEKTIHTKEKPHACKFCDEKFNFSLKLLIHLRTKHFDLLRQQDRKTGTVHKLFLIAN